MKVSSVMKSIFTMAYFAVIAVSVISCGKNETSSSAADKSSSRTDQTSSKTAIPEFEGVYVTEQNQLVRLKPGTATNYKLGRFEITVRSPRLTMGARPNLTRLRFKSRPPGTPKHFEGWDGFLETNVEGNSAVSQQVLVESNSQENIPLLYAPTNLNDVVICKSENELIPGIYGLDWDSDYSFHVEVAAYVAEMEKSVRRALTVDQMEGIDNSTKERIVAAAIPICLQLEIVQDSKQQQWIDTEFDLWKKLIKLRFDLKSPLLDKTLRLMNRYMCEVREKDASDLINDINTKLKSIKEYEAKRAQFIQAFDAANSAKWMDLSEIYTKNYSVEKWEPQESELKNYGNIKNWDDFAVLVINNCNLCNPDAVLLAYNKLFEKKYPGLNDLVYNRWSQLLSGDKKYDRTLDIIFCKLAVSQNDPKYIPILKMILNELGQMELNRPEYERLEQCIESLSKIDNKGWDVTDYVRKNSFYGLYWRTRLFIDRPANSEEFLSNVDCSSQLDAEQKQKIVDELHPAITNRDVINSLLENRQRAIITFHIDQPGKAVVLARLPKDKDRESQFMAFQLSTDTKKDQWVITSSIKIGNTSGRVAIKEDIVNALKWNPAKANEVAWEEFSSKSTNRDIVFALALARASVDASGSNDNDLPNRLDTLANCQCDLGEYDNAIESESKAIGLYKNNAQNNQDGLAVFQKTLEMFQTKRSKSNARQAMEKASPATIQSTVSDRYKLEGYEIDSRRKYNEAVKAANSGDWERVSQLVISGTATNSWTPSPEGAKDNDPWPTWSSLAHGVIKNDIKGQTDVGPLIQYLTRSNKLEGAGSELSDLLKNRLLNKNYKNLSEISSYALATKDKQFIPLFKYYLNAIARDTPDTASIKISLELPISWLAKLDQDNWKTGVFVDFDKDVWRIKDYFSNFDSGKDVFAWIDLGDRSKLTPEKMQTRLKEIPIVNHPEVWDRIAKNKNKYLTICISEPRSCVVTDRLIPDNENKSEQIVLFDMIFKMKDENMGQWFINNAMVVGETKGNEKLKEKIVEALQWNPNIAKNVARNEIDSTSSERDLKFALNLLDASRQYVNQDEYLSYLLILARCNFEMGDIESAIKNQTSAVEIIDKKTDLNDTMKKRYHDQLDRYKGRQLPK